MVFLAAGSTAERSFIRVTPFLLIFSSLLKMFFVFFSNTQICPHPSDTPLCWAILVRLRYVDDTVIFLRNSREAILRQSMSWNTLSSPLVSPLTTTRPLFSSLALTPPLLKNLLPSLELRFLRSPKLTLVSLSPPQVVCSMTVFPSLLRVLRFSTVLDISPWLL